MKKIAMLALVAALSVPLHAETAGRHWYLTPTRVCGLVTFALASGVALGLAAYENFQPITVFLEHKNMQDLADQPTVAAMDAYLLDDPVAKGLLEGIKIAWNKTKEVVSARLVARHIAAVPAEKKARSPRSVRLRTKRRRSTSPTSVTTKDLL